MRDVTSYSFLWFDAPRGYVSSSVLLFVFRRFLGLSFCLVRAFALGFVGSVFCCVALLLVFVFVVCPCCCFCCSFGVVSSGWFLVGSGARFCFCLRSGFFLVFVLLRWCRVCVSGVVFVSFLVFRFSCCWRLFAFVVLLCGPFVSVLLVLSELFTRS